MAKQSKGYAKKLVGKSFGCEIDFEIEGNSSIKNINVYYET